MPLWQLQGQLPLCPIYKQMRRETPTNIFTNLPLDEEEEFSRFICCTNNLLRSETTGKSTRFLIRFLDPSFGLNLGNLRFVFLTTNCRLPFVYIFSCCNCFSFQILSITSFQNYLTITNYTFSYLLIISSASFRLSAGSQVLSSESS